MTVEYADSPKEADVWFRNWRREWLDNINRIEARLYDFSANLVEEIDLILAVDGEPPLFHGGREAFQKFLVDSLRYPKQAIKQGIQGTVFVTFVIDRDGTPLNVKILRGIGGGCDEEVIRLVESMPKWTPGKRGGKPSLFKLVCL